MSEAQCRWGILSTAGIAKKNYRGIWFSGNGQVVAVASRQRKAAQQFIDECQRDNPFPQAPEAVEGYDELLDRNDIDAVYIPLPTAMRKEWVIRAAERGKHVLCEKPIALSVADAEEMLSACSKHNVQFMDGVMFMHSARLEALRARLDDPHGIGPLRRIASQFTFYGDETFQRENIRVKQQLEPFGCLGDLGWYNLRLTLWAAGGRMPHSVIARNLAEFSGDGSTGPVPGAHSAELLFDDDFSAGFYCSFTAEINQWAVITGRNGYIQMDDFVLPFYGNYSEWKQAKHHYRIEGCRFNMERREETLGVIEYSNGEPDAQEVNMVREFGRLALSGQPDPTWGEWSLKTQRLLDACTQSAREGGKLIQM